jgi:hypothetical protein
VDRKNSPYSYSLTGGKTQSATTMRVIWSGVWTKQVKQLDDGPIHHQWCLLYHICRQKMREFKGPRSANNQPSLGNCDEMGQQHMQAGMGPCSTQTKLLVILVPEWLTIISLPAWTTPSAPQPQPHSMQTTLVWCYPMPIWVCHYPSSDI